MGQQQLLLLILSSIIVGVAIVIGINTFGENAVQANQDSVTQDVLTLASRAQGWYRRPAQLGGGGRSFTGIQLEDLNFAASNENGSYDISVTGGGDSLQIVGTGNEDGDGDSSPLTVTINVGADGVSAASITQ